MRRFTFCVLPFAFCVGLTACQQRMAEQPGHRGYEASEFFPNGQGARPLEPGVVYRGERPNTDPMVTGFSAAGQKHRTGDPTGKGAWDEKTAVVPPKGAPDKLDNYVAEFPFEMTEGDLKRGQQRYTIFCAVCHGAAGDANGKVVERGYLRPPSFHTDPEGKKTDWSTLGEASKTDKGETGLPQGYSRGFFRYGIRVPIREVPVGYIFQVITWGYGGMPDYSTQVPPEDRWRIAAYIRALQLSQGAAVAELPGTTRQATEAALNRKPAEKAGGHGH